MNNYSPNIPCFLAWGLQAVVSFRSGNHRQIGLLSIVPLAIARKKWRYNNS